MTVLAFLFWLIAVFQFKHFIADYLLQGRWMLGKFLPGWAWVAPLAAHCGVHAVFTFLISSAAYSLAAMPAFGLASLQLALIDFVVHFVMDRVKASPNLLGRFRALSSNEMKNILSYEQTTGLEKFRPQLVGNRMFWISLGFDQLVHHLTDLYIVWRIVTLA